MVLLIFSEMGLCSEPEKLWISPLPSMVSRMMIPCYLRNTAGHHDLLVGLEAPRDLVLEVLLGGVLDGAGVEEP